MSLIAFLIFGIVVGFLARALMPGRQSMGVLMTMVLGVVGSFIGGFLGSMISGSAYDRLHPAGIIGSVIGAMIVLAVASMGRRKLV